LGITLADCALDSSEKASKGSHLPHQCSELGIDIFDVLDEFVHAYH